MCFVICIVMCWNIVFLFLAVADINPFGALDATERLRIHPKTAGYFSDPSFVEGLSILARDHLALQR